MAVPHALVALCDDAAVFPPGLAPLADAVRGHDDHLAAPYGALVGPLVLPAAVLPEVGPLVAGRPDASLRVALTVPDQHGVADALAAVDALPALGLAALEVPLAPGVDPGEAVATIERGLGGRPVEVFVEVPRDTRRAATLDAVGSAGLLAKFRTGGVRADLHPDEAELADALVAVAARGLGFKATAGLHHAVRATDPGTGFEQHGFLNLLVAADAAAAGASGAEVARLLAERDPATVASLARPLLRAPRGLFRSFGTCSITEPVVELVALGLLDEGQSP